MIKHIVALFIVSSVVACGDPPSTTGSGTASGSAAKKASATASGSSKPTTSATTSAAAKPETSASAEASASASAAAGGDADEGTGEGFDSAEALAKHIVATAAEMKPEDVKKAYATDEIIDKTITCKGEGPKENNRKDVAKALKEKPLEGGPFTFVSAESKPVKTFKKGDKQGDCEFNEEMSQEKLTIKMKGKDGKEQSITLEVVKAGGKWFASE